MSARCVTVFRDGLDGHLAGVSKLWWMQVAVHERTKEEEWGFTYIWKVGGAFFSEADFVRGPRVENGQESMNTTRRKI